MNKDEIGTVIRVTKLLTNSQTIRQFFEPDFAVTNFPVQEQSNDLKRVINEKDEEFPIDEILGKYVVEENKIIIYSEAIRQVSNILKVNQYQLTHIVELYEGAHSMVYQGIPREIANRDEQNNYVKNQRELLKNISPAIHEQLAQLITWQILQKELADEQRPEFRKWHLQSLKVFEILESKQPHHYHIGGLKTIERIKLLAAYRNIKSLSDINLWIKSI